VRTAFAENFLRRYELGGACCLYYHGAKFVGTALTGDPRDLALRKAVYSIIPPTV
jgi:hypothetical protein